MAKDIEEKKLKKEKKDKKEKRSETDGVSKSKKDKKEKKIQVDSEMVDALEAELEKAPEVQLVRIADGSSDDEPRGALVPFAFPLADNDKEVKKILKTVKKCMSYSSIPNPPHTSQQTANTFPSRKNQNPPPRRQRSRQSAPQIRRLSALFILRVRPLRHRCYRRRHLPHGRHLAHPRALRRPQRAVHLHQVARAAGRGERYEAAHQRGYDCQRPRGEEEGG